MDVLCFGIIVVDHRYENWGKQEMKLPLKIVDKAVDLHIGGIPIVAVVMAKMGFKVGLMGNIGGDIAGYGLMGYLADKIGIDVEAIKIINAPTSSSFIKLTNNQRYIEHTPGASQKLLPSDMELALIKNRKPKLMAIGYSGLLPQLDANNGEKMTRWITSVQGNGVLAALDTHTVPPYSMLGKPACVADIFICNQEESEGITNISEASSEVILNNIWQKYIPKISDKYRLFGIAKPDGVQLAYGNRDIHVNKWVANPYYGRFTPKDLTGAGDYLRSGIYGYIIKNRDAFLSGLLDVEKTGQYGLYVAYQCLSKCVESSLLFKDIESSV